MQKTLTTLLCCFALIQSFGQSQRNVSTYLSIQYNHTLYDYTKGNNPHSFGLGLQTFFNNKNKLKPTVELTGYTYLYDDKVYRLYPGDSTEGPDRVGGMVNLFAGLSYHPIQELYLSFIAGPSFINGQTYFGIKPSLGFYFSKSQKWTGKVSYINIFNRVKTLNEDFGSLSFAIGFKLF